MDPAPYIDIYCERTAGGFWAEPLNAITNIAFIIAALMAWPAAWRRPERSPLELIVIALVAIIGIGSFLFHTLATPFSAALDVIPIWLFFFLYILLLFVRVTKGNTFDLIGYMIATIMAFAALVFLMGLASRGGDAPLNGSLQYAPALFAMALASALAAWRRHPVWRYFAAATALFIVSLIFRSLDQAACAATAGFGTHFLWHLLNATVLGILLQGAIRELPPAQYRVPSG